MNESLSFQTITKIAESFWDKAGGIKKWPCDLEQAASSTLPLDTICLSCLTIKKINSWLNERNVSYPFPRIQSRLHGCLLVYRGAGFVFIDGSDSKPERFYTLAHEVSHFMVEYLIPRRKALELFGESILEVLDGFRPPTPEERINSIITSIDVQPYIHLLEHNHLNSTTRYKIWQVENRADQLALEMIAPFRKVSNDLTKSNKTKTYDLCYNAATKLLTRKYGLPASIANGYAERLTQSITGGPSVLSYLGLE